MPKVKLTTRYVESIEPPTSGFVLHYDTKVAGLAVSVTAKGGRTWVLYTRYPSLSGPVPSRRALGAAPRVGVVVTNQLSLEAARRKAAAWIGLIAEGIDPAQKLKREREQARAKRDLSFGAVVETYIARHVREFRRAEASEREIRRNLLPRWKNKIVTEITKHDVVDLIDEIVGRGTKREAHAAFSHARAFFNWCIGRGMMETSPCDRLRPGKLIGPKNVRKRVLTDDELFACWRAARRLGPIYCAAIRMLMLTGQRRSEIAECTWPEIDFRRGCLVVPPERFKSNASHTVWLSAEATTILSALPRGNRGSFVFSTTNGRRPISGFSKAKAALNRHMLRTLRALARVRGEDWRRVTLKRFVLHDIRRTCRTRLSELRVRTEVAERIIGHGSRDPLERTYDQHEYADEMSEAMKSWEHLLTRITSGRRIKQRCHPTRSRL